MPVVDAIRTTGATTLDAISRALNRAAFDQHGAGDARLVGEEPVGTAMHSRSTAFYRREFRRSLFTNAH
jgi:hypothetical protein